MPPKILKSAAEIVKDAIKAVEAEKKAGKTGEILESRTAPATTPRGGTLLPRSQGMYPPDVPQVDLPRQKGVDKARAEGKKPKYTERMQSLLDSPTVRKKVDKLIAKGQDLGMQEWYGTEPLRQVALDVISPQQYESLMAQLASASQRNPVDQQNLMGSYLYYLQQQGKLDPEAVLLTNKLKEQGLEGISAPLIEFPEGYGSLAQSAIFERGKQIASGDIAGALPPEKKLGTFYRNLLGNLQPVTVDVNAVRGPVIEAGDPRWLTSKLVEKDEAGKVKNVYFPRQMVEEGEMSIREAKQRPGFWEAAPSGSEYAGFEDLWQRAARREGVAPAEAQALGWYGSADVTALKTKPELYVDNLERLLNRTAEVTGKSPLEVLRQFLKGEEFLKKAKGGSIDLEAEYRMGKGGLLKKAVKAVKDAIQPTAPQDEALRIAQKNAAKPVSEGGLGLPPDNTPMDRAKAMGYGDPIYRGYQFGTGRNKATFYSSSPDLASAYAVRDPGFQYEVLSASGDRHLFGSLDEAKIAQQDVGGKIKKLKEAPTVQKNVMRSPKPLVIDAEGSNWNFIRNPFAPPENFENLQRRLNSVSKNLVINGKPYTVNQQKADILRDEYFNVYTDTNLLAELAKKRGYDSITIKNLFDVPLSAAGTDKDVKYLLSDVSISLKPENVRSRFAAFDPARIDESDLLAGFAALGITAPMLTSEEPEYRSGGAVMMADGGDLEEEYNLRKMGMDPTRVRGGYERKPISRKEIQAMMLDVASGVGVPFAEAGSYALRGKTDEAKESAAIEAALIGVPGAAVLAKPAYRAVKKGVQKAAPAARDLAREFLESGMESGLIQGPSYAVKPTGERGIVRTAEEQSVIDKFGQKQEREAVRSKKVQNALKESASESLEGPIKSTKTKRPRVKVEPDFYRKMAEEQGDEAVLRAARAGKHLKPTGVGYIGAPRTVTSPQGLGVMRRDMDKDFADAVDAVRLADPERLGTWYDRAKQGIAESVEPYQLARALEQHGVYSAGVSPESELTFALKHLNSRVAGNPKMAYRGAGMRNLDEAVAEDRPANMGFKIGEYAQKNDPRVPNAGLFGVNDFRRAQGMGYTDPEGNPWKAGVSDTMHPFMDAETALQVDRANAAGIGGRTDWAGPHIQEVPWVYGKAQDLYSRGKRGRYAGDELEGIKTAIQDANNTARDYMYKHAASATHEAIPGASLNHVRQALDMTPEEKLAYGQIGRWDQLAPETLLNEFPEVGAGNRDIIYGALGYRQLPSRQAQGLYTNKLGKVETNPMTIARPLMDFPTGGSGLMAPDSRGVMDAAEQFRALMDAQEAGAYNLPNTMGSVKGKSSMVLDTRSMNPDKLLDPSAGVLPTSQQLAKMGDVMGDYGFGVTSSNRGAVVFPYDAQINPKEASDVLRKASKKLQKIYPSSQEKSLTTMGYVPGVGKRSPEGPLSTKPFSGEATSDMLRAFADLPPAVALNLGESEAVRAAIQAKALRDAQMGGARKDIQETRKFFSKADWPKAVAMMRKGMTPAAALAALGYNINAMAADKQ